MEISAPEYHGKDRRNGSKLKLCLMDYAKLLMIILPLFAGGVVAYMQIGINSTALAENGIKIEETLVVIELILFFILFPLEIIYIYLLIFSFI